MGQPGFFDLDERYRGLDAKKDPLVVLNAVVPWEDFRARLSAVWRKPEEERKRTRPDASLGTRSSSSLRENFHRAIVGRRHGSASVARGAGIRAQWRHADRLETRPLGAFDEAVD